MSERKEKSVTIRLEDILWEELTGHSQEKGVSKSEITREALNKYLSNFRYTNPMVLIGRNLFSYLLSRLNNEEIIELAKISFENALKTRKVWAKQFLKVENPDEFIFNARNTVDSIISYMSEEGQNWFHKIKTIWHKDSLIIYGKHDNGINFSKFISYRFAINLEPFAYKLKLEQLTESSVYLELVKK